MKKAFNEYKETVKLFKNKYGVNMLKYRILSVLNFTILLPWSIYTIYILNRDFSGCIFYYTEEEKLKRIEETACGMAMLPQMRFIEWFVGTDFVYNYVKDQLM